MAILTIKNLSFSYPLCEGKVLDNISFEVEAGSFMAVCGATGSGKSTLLRCLKNEYGLRAGYVCQRPEQQIVTDKVWHELAFGLENLGLPSETIRRRVSEMAVYFGIEDWFEKSVSELSGGQKQLLNLAAVMVMQPEILLLDEPTAQLDPIAASGFLDTVAKINRDFATTVLIAEHRLEDLLPLVDHCLVLDRGHLIICDETSSVISAICSGRVDNEPLLKGMPAAVKLAAVLGAKEEVLTIRQGRDYIEKNYKNDIRGLEDAFGHTGSNNDKRKPALQFSEVFFKYNKEDADVCQGLSFSVYEKECFCLLGGNGSGKTTALSIASGLLRPYSGKVKVFDKKLSEYKNQSLYNECLSLLPQDVQTVFMKNTVREELEGIDLSGLPFVLDELLEKHPYDLSGGQQQLVALAKVLAKKPRILLLDEPTKGLDALTKQGLLYILRQLKEKGVTVLVVTHDLEFAAECADRCALMFRGEITSIDEPHIFFAENRFYTTAANRITRGYYDGMIRVEEAIRLCEKNGRKSL